MKKNLFKSLLILVGLLCSSISANSQTNPYDVNKDGSVDISDVNAVINYICGGVKITSITLSETDITLNVADTFALKATIKPDFVNDMTIIWESSNPSVASVSKEGIITAISAGTATIIVTTTDGSKTATCKVTVTTPTILGYYSFKATSKAEIASLTADDFTALTDSTSEVPCGVAGLMTVLTTGTTAPSYYTWSVMDNGYSDEIVMKAGVTSTGTTKEIDGKTYNLWYWATSTDASDNTKVKIILK